MVADFLNRSCTFDARFESILLAAKILLQQHRPEADVGCAEEMVLQHAMVFTEVHHIEALSEGGEDVLENVAYLCPAHHRELYVGRRAPELSAALRALRDAKQRAEG